MERGYSVTIADASRELTAKEKVMFKDTSDCIRLDEATKEGEIIIKPIEYIVLNVHNEKSDDKDYNNFILVDADGFRYLTGSTNLFNTFYDIFNEMKGVDEDWSLKIYRLPSKNYKGKEFITCSIV